MVDIYLEGGCFHLYLLLKKLCPEAEPWYNRDHIVTKIGKKFYDITGVVNNKDNKYIKFKEYFNKKNTSKVVSQFLKNDIW